MSARQLPAWLLGGLCLLASAGCNKTTTEPEPEPEVVQVSYTQTQCADPWGFVRGSQPLIDSASAYLRRRSITFTKAQTSQVNLGGVCAACTCPTGVELVGAVPVAQLTAIQALGFKKK